MEKVKASELIRDITEAPIEDLEEAFLSMVVGDQSKQAASGIDESVIVDIAEQYGVSPESLLEAVELLGEEPDIGQAPVERKVADLGISEEEYREVLGSAILEAASDLGLLEDDLSSK